MGVYGMRTLGVSPGQMSMILTGAVAGEEVIIHTFIAMDVSMLMLLNFLTLREHLLWILFLSLVWRDDEHVGGLASGKSVVCRIQSCPLALSHIWNCFSEISIALVPPNVMPKYLFSMS